MMKKYAFLFPGQGAQVPGMIKDICDAYPEARAVVDEVQDVLQVISLFLHQYPNPDMKIPAKELYEWHHKLTGSCTAGRNHFALEHGINIEKDQFTVREFIALTENSYGGDVIKQLKAKLNDDQASRYSLCSDRRKQADW